MDYPNQMDNYVKESIDRDNLVKSKANQPTQAPNPLSRDTPAFPDQNETTPVKKARKPKFLSAKDIQNNKAKNAFRAYQEKVVKALDKQRIASFGFDNN